MKYGYTEWRKGILLEDSTSRNGLSYLKKGTTVLYRKYIHKNEGKSVADQFWDDGHTFYEYKDLDGQNYFHSPQKLVDIFNVTIKT